MATGQSWVRPELAGDLVQQVLDVVADAPGPVGTQVGEVLAHLGRVDARQLGEALRGDGADLLVGGLEQRPVVERQAERPSPPGCVARRALSRVVLVPTLSTGARSHGADAVEAWLDGRDAGTEATLRWSWGWRSLAVAVSSVFAQSMLVRYTSGHQPQHRAWAIALAMFALASVALATGTATGWDNGTFRVFYLLGAVVNVPWLAMGTVYLLARPEVARRVHWGLVLVQRLRRRGAAQLLRWSRCTARAIPVGKDVFGALPRILAGVGSGVAAVVIVAGALVSAWRFPRDPELPDHGRLAGANGLIALGTLVLSSGGLVQGAVGHDEAFALSLAVGITIVYCGFVLASGRAGNHSQCQNLTESDL